VVIEVPPLDFNEYLSFKQIQISFRDSHLTSGYFEDFLKTGGMPEYVLREDDQYLRELVDDIIVKDIAAVHGVRDIGLLKSFFLLLMERAGKAFSINKLANIADISPDTARRYVDMFADAFLIHLVPRHGKTNEKILSPKKIYAADCGIRSLFAGFRDKGSIFENYVYLKIRHRSPAYVRQDGIEIDFFTDDKMLIEVKYGGTMTDKQRELFESFSAQKKVLIDSIDDLNELDEPRLVRNSGLNIQE
jgi:predicted AAA+ superfamily ATPase